MQPRMLTLDIDEVSIASRVILNTIQMNDIDANVAFAATALTLAQLSARSAIDEETWVKFVQDLSQWVDAYWAPGVVN